MDSRNEDPSSTTRKIVQPRVVKRQNAPNENERESKRSRSVGTSIQSSQQENETKDGSLKSGGSQDESEEYLVILRRIANHISQPRKFVKASELMRRLLKELGEKESRSSSIQDGVLEVLRASMKDPGNVLDPAFAVEYSRLFSTAPSYLENLSSEQKLELEIYEIWGGLRSKMITTDDSFEYSRLTARLREMIESLPKVRISNISEETITAAKDEFAYREAEEEAALVALLPPRYLHGNDAKTPPTAGSKDTALVPTDPREGNSYKASHANLTSTQYMALRRTAVLDCVLAGKLMYKWAWARSAVENLVQNIVENYLDRFLQSQSARILEMKSWIRDQKTSLRKGVTSKDLGRDSSSFEKMQDVWGRSANVSGRGAIGSGDRKAGIWLG